MTTARPAAGGSSLRTDQPVAFGRLAPVDATHAVFPPVVADELVHLVGHARQASSFARTEA